MKKNGTKFSLMKIVKYIMCGAFTALAVLTDNINCMVLAAAGFWCCVSLGCFSDIRKNIALFCTYLSVFVFLIGRPLYEVIMGLPVVDTQVSYGAEESSVRLALLLIFMSLLCISAGSHAADLLRMKGRCGKRARNKTNHNTPALFGKVRSYFQGMDRGLRFRSLIPLYIICYISMLAQEVEKYIFVLNNSYTAFYAKFVSGFPYWFYVIGSMYEFIFIFMLACLPSKKASWVLMDSFVFSRLFIFLAGKRSNMVLAVMFCIIYIMFRDRTDPSEKWIGKKEKWTAGAGAALSIPLLAAMNYLRDGTGVFSLNPLLLFSDFVNKQGVTFSWICVGLTNAEILRNQGVASYTFGAFIDYIKYNPVAVHVFNMVPLGNLQTAENATAGSLLEHHLSYLVFGNKYYKGRGTGSSYLLELFLDYKWAGVLLFSLIVGLLLGSMYEMMKKGTAMRVVCMCMIDGLLFMPRSQAMYFLSFSYRMAFWAALACWICMMILYRYREAGRTHRSRDHNGMCGQ